MPRYLRIKSPWGLLKVGAIVAVSVAAFYAGFVQNGYVGGVTLVATVCMLAGFAVAVTSENPRAIGWSLTFFWPPFMTFLLTYRIGAVNALLAVLSGGLILSGFYVVRREFERCRQYEVTAFIGMLWIVLGLLIAVGLMFYMANPASFGAGFSAFSKDSCAVHYTHNACLQGGAAPSS